jgi:hypothetical protein
MSNGQKFVKNPSSGSRVSPCGRRDMTQLTVAFRNFANAPKNKVMNSAFWCGLSQKQYADRGTVLQAEIAFACCAQDVTPKYNSCVTLLVTSLSVCRSVAHYCTAVDTSHAKETEKLLCRLIRSPSFLDKATPSHTSHIQNPHQQEEVSRYTDWILKWE